MSQFFNYATIEIMPYPDLGEFVIVGILAMTPGRTMGHRLLPVQKTTRLTKFFPEIDRQIFTDTLASAHREIGLIAAQVNETNGSGAELLPLDDQDGGALFRLLTSPKEGMLQVRQRGTAKASDLEHWLDEAFHRFVLRTPNSPSYPAERIFTNEIRNFLKELKLAQFYRETQVGDDRFHMVFPLAYTPVDSGIPQRAIKPLHLRQATATQILDHGDTWLQKVRRLRQFGTTPDEVIFPIQLPTTDERDFSERSEVAQYLMEDFRKEGVTVIDEDHFAQLRPKVIFPNRTSDEGLFAS